MYKNYIKYLAVIFSFLITFSSIHAQVGGSPIGETPQWKVLTKSSTYTAKASEYIILSGASFTVTLESAVGKKGKLIGLYHNGTSLTQVYTLNSTSGQTIAGQSSGTYKLVTNGEALYLISDNSNWVQSAHFSDTAWVNSGVIAIGATTTAPTKGNTVETDKLWWRRQGDSAIIRYEYSQASATGAAAGSGDYKFPVPANMTIDTAKVTANAVVGSPFLAPGVVGSFSCSAGGSIYPGCAAWVFDSAYVRLACTNAATTSMVGSAVFAINNANISYSGTIIVPITGWQP